MDVAEWEAMIRRLEGRPETRVFARQAELMARIKAERRRKSGAAHEVEAWQALRERWSQSQVEER